MSYMVRVLRVGLKTLLLNCPHCLKTYNRISKIYVDKIDGIISDDQWQQMHSKYNDELNKLSIQLERHSNANINYYEKVRKS